LGFDLSHIGLWGNARLWYILHILIDGVHVVDVGRWIAATVFNEVTHFSAIEAGSLGLGSCVILLYRGIHCIAVLLFHRDNVGVGIVTPILSSIVWRPGVGQVHGYRDIVICWLWSVGGVICWFLLLLLWLGPLLVLLGVSSPSMRSELSLYLSLVVAESSWIWQSSSGSDEFNHLLPFDDIDGPRLVFIVILGKWYLDDFI
jgi:hypothetical protein